MIVGITFGAFDLLHAGHISMLAEAKQNCDWLIVGLHTDPTIDRPYSKNKPVQSTFERYVQLSAIRHVDNIIPYDTEQDLVNMLSTLCVQKRFIGADYSDKNKEITGLNICRVRDIQIVFLERYHNFSSSELRERCKKQSS